MTKLIMKNNYLAVKNVEKQKTKSGIVLPPGVDEDGWVETADCEVVAASKDSEYKEGDIVLFSRVVTEDMIIDKEKIWLVKESDIKAIVK